MNNNVRFPYRFFVITFIWSWIIWTPLVLGSLHIIPIPEHLWSILTIPVIMLGVFGPLVGALFALYKEHGKGSSRRFLRSFLDFHLGWKTYVYSIIIFGVSTFIAWFLPELFGEERSPMLLPSVWIVIPYLIMMILLGGGQEEFGWRGYALAVLENKFGIWVANMILGLIWSFWHLPLFFITGASQSYMNFGGFVLLIVGYSYILSWFREISGNKAFSAMFVHGFFNALIPLMPTIILKENVPQPRFWIWAILTFLIGILITILRKKKKIMFPTQANLDNH